MEKGPSPEQEPKRYSLAACFHTREEAAVPYYAAQETVLRTECELSAYRFMRQWEEVNDKPWLVVVVGLKPAEAVEKRLESALSLGEMTSVPEEVVEMLMLRHITETAKKGPWVEGHYKEGLQFTSIKFSKRPGGGKRKNRRKH